MEITHKEDSRGTVFSTRNISYLDVNGLCWYLFKDKQVDEWKVPSYRKLESVKPKILEYLRENSQLICNSKILDANKKNITDRESSYMVAMMTGDDSESSIHVFMFNTFDKKELKSPVLIKIWEDGGGMGCGASSFDVESLDVVVNFLHKKYKAERDFSKNTFFGILTNNGDSISVTELPIDDKFSKNLDIKLNYGKGFEAHHTGIVKKLEENSNGLFILHGSAGTGKTTYIKYLAKIFGGKRKFIFIPTTFIDALTSPNIIPVLLEHPNSILVLEDAEKAVRSREENHGNESLVSSLLNIGDGILGSMLNLSIILTFNTSRDNIDAALLRKGRLHYEHEFGKLSIEDAQKIADVTKKNYKVMEPMSLAEIYNIDVDNNHKVKETSKMGFGA